MILTMMFQTGGHPRSSWRVPGNRFRETTDLSYYTELALSAENAGFDAIFMADQLDIEADSWDDLDQPLEPFTLLSALAAVTSRIGIIGTGSTTYSEPYLLARQYASLDHISGGRAGWNVVTTASPRAAANYGYAEHPAHADRYRRSDEFVEVVKQLWGSWPTESFVIDRAAGVATDRSLVSPIDHDGEFFRVRGPLNVPSPPQGWPVISMAGQSPAALDVAGRHADLVFGMEHDRARAVAFRDELRGRAVRFGRSPEAINLLPGVIPVIGETRREAEELQRTVRRLGSHDLLIDELSGWLGLDLRSTPGSTVLHPETLNHPDTVRGLRSQYIEVFRRLEAEPTTVDELLAYYLAQGRYAFLTAAGTAADVADLLEEWLDAGAADGFTLVPGPGPRGSRDFFAQVVPELIRRGRFTPKDPGLTLRERLGLEAAPTPVR